MKLSLSEISKYLQTTETTYIIIVLVVLFIGYGISLTRDGRKSFKYTITRLPVISIFLLLVFILSLYNQLAACLCIIGLGIILLLPDVSPTLESFKNKNDSDVEDSKDSKDSNEADEADESTELDGQVEVNEDIEEKIDNDVDADEDETPKSLAVKPKEPTKNFLSKSLGMHDNKYGDMFNAAVQENKKAMKQRIKTVRNNNKRHSSNGRENYKNTASNDLSIARRQFNLNDEIDKDLLNTREICTDIINRVNYEYEDKEYLKKYIAARVEEIIEINKLLDD
jgi:hypothetical protein